MNMKRILQNYYHHIITANMDGVLLDIISNKINDYVWNKFDVWKELTINPTNTNVYNSVQLNIQNLINIHYIESNTE